jgi:hypothetical protein
MKSNTEKEVIEKLKEYDIKVFNTVKEKKESFIMADNLVISCMNNKILINFHITSKPSYTARIMNILHEIKTIKNFYIGEDFVFNTEGKYLEGKEAETEFSKFQEEQIINNFMREQYMLQMMGNMKEGYVC